MVTPEAVSDQQLERALSCYLPRANVLDSPDRFQLFSYGKRPRYKKILAAVYDAVTMIDVGMYQMVVGPLGDRELLITQGLTTCTGFALRFVPEGQGEECFALGHFSYDACVWAKIFVDDICQQRKVKMTALAVRVVPYHHGEVSNLMDQWKKVYPDLEVKLEKERGNSRDVEGLVISRSGGRLLNFHYQPDKPTGYQISDRWFW